MDGDLIDRLVKLSTGLVADALDRLSYRSQVMDPRLRPLYPAAVVAGRALTALAVPTTQIASTPFKGQLEMIDALRPGDVLVASTSGFYAAALLGDLLCTRARLQGCRGMIVDGAIRDRQRIMAMEFPIFATALSPADSLGRMEVIARNTSIVCGGVSVNPGDLILADGDGVVVVPSEVAERAIAEAEDKARAEALVEEELRQGKPVVSVFDKHQVL